MYSVVKTGGKQYKVSQGDVINIEKIDGEAGSTVEFDEVLMTGGDGTTEIGAPLLEGKKVTAKILKQIKGPKILILKHLRRKNSRKKQGHRQNLTTVEIVSID